ncbi:MAG: alginate export family protein [Candidatus Hydrogenedentota bacterium]
MTIRALILLTVIFAIPLPSHAELEPSTGTRIADFATIGGEIRPRFEYSSNFGGDRAAREENEMVFMRTRANVDIDVSDQVFARIEIQDFRRWGDPLSNASGTTDAADLVLREGYLELTDLWSGRISTKLGRQAIVRGEERLLGDLDWHRIGRTHDAAVVSLRPGESHRMDFLFISVTENDNIGSTAAAKSGVDGDAFLWGMYGDIKWKPFTKFQPFWIYQDYDSSTLPALVPQVAGSGSSGSDFRVHTFGLLAGGEFLERWSWNAEGHYQAGDFGVRKLSAYLAHGRLSYAPGLTHLSRISTSYDIYSGDRNAADNTIQTYQPVFPSYYEHTGRIGRLGMKNLDRFRLALSGAFLAGWQWRLDWHNFRSNSRADHLYATTGGVFLATGGAASRSVGNEYDASLSFPWKPNVTFTTTASVFHPGEASRQAVRNAGGAPGRTIDATAQVEVKF